MDTKIHGYENSCRTCSITQREKEFLQLFQTKFNDITLCDMFTSLTSITIKPNDELPLHICESCVSLLISSFEFRQKCIEIDIQRRNEIGIPKYNDSDKNVEFAQVSVSATLDIKNENDPEKESNLNNVLNVKLEPNVTSENDDSEIDNIFNDNDDDDDSNYNDEDDLPLKSFKKLIKQKNTLATQPVHLECEHCKETFSKQIHYKKHIRQYNETTGLCAKPSIGFPCEICDKIFPKPSRLKRHIRVHDSTGKPFECKTCKHRFANISNLIRHEIKHSELMQLSTTFGSNEPRIFTCLDCNETFEKQQSLASHMKIHKSTTDLNDFKCNYCTKVFTNLNSRRKHMKFHDEEKSNKCHICNQMFGLGSHLIDHMIKKHEGIKPFVCPHCNKGFHTSTLLKYHIRVHTKETPYLCSECGKAFSSSGNLSQHLLIHTGEKNFTCPDCPAKFATKGTLKYHLKTHTGEKPYTCELCGRAFAINSALTKHKLTHTGERPIACDLCDKRFRNGYAYKRHRLTHTGEKPYKCKYCERAFAQSNDLVKHTRSHVGDNTYQCKQCPSNFRLNRELKAHEHGHYLEEKAQLEAAQANNVEDEKFVSTVTQDAS